MLGLIALLITSPSASAGGKLLGTAGVSPIEGGGGGGLIPWAPLAGYATQDEWGTVASMSQTDLSDFTMTTYSAAVNYHDKVEVSVARMDFQAKAGGAPIRQNVIGIKTKILGDLIYGKTPLVSVGLQHKTLLDKQTATALGADDTEGTDIYISTARAWIDGLANRTSVINVNLRYSEANQLGLLGFGAKDSDREWLLEAAAALYLNRYWAIGVEYREKPDQLSGFKEDDWMDLFLVYFPTKSASITAAYLQMGDIAGQEDQTGWYVSLQGAF